jgi:hypothetical protein
VGTVTDTADDGTLTVETDPEEVILQAESLFDLHNNVSRVIRDLNLPVENLPDGYNEAGKTDDTLDFEAMLRLWLYMEVGGFSQQEVVNRVQNWPYLQQRFDLNRVPRQATISHTERRRFSLAVREYLAAVAKGIQEVAQEKDIRSSDLASPDEADPKEVAASDQPLYQYVDQHAPGLISEMLDTVTPAFDTGRASNTSHTDRDIWKQQTAMSLMPRAGTPSAYRHFNKFKPNPAHHDTHTRVVKKLGTPEDNQVTFDDIMRAGGDYQLKPEWRRIADTIQPQFNSAVERMLDSLRGSDMFTEPVVAAIDTTGFEFYSTPWKGEDDIEPDGERVVVNQRTGNTKVPKDDYPTMVNGAEESGVYEYQYATLTIVARNVPLVLAVEPVRHHSTWEGEDGLSVSWAEIVDRLLEQATDLVDIHMVMADKAFDQHGVYHVLDQRHDVDYLIPKKRDSQHLRRQAESVCDDDALTARVEQDAPLHLRDDTPYIQTECDPGVGDDNYSHEMTFMHVPADRDDWIVRHADDTGYAIFATNRDDVSPLDAEGVTNRYSERWDIENEYRMIQPLMPSIRSTAYEMRLFAFVFSCLLYNLWRLVDHRLKELASEAFDDYGRGPHEERLDPVVTMADFLASSLVVFFRDGWDPPDADT